MTSTISKQKVLVADLQCLLAAFLFGIGFLGQREISVAGLGPMTCNTFRFGLSAILLILFLPWLPNDNEDKNSDDEESDNDEIACEESDEENKPLQKRIKKIKHQKEISEYVLFRLLGSNMYTKRFAKHNIWYWGICLGGLNFLGSGFQQWGITMTSASKVAFIAGFDLFLTPIFGLFIPTFKTNAEPQLSTWLAVFLSLIGLFLLSGASLNDFEMGMGETITLVSTVFWTLHITYTDIGTGIVSFKLFKLFKFYLIKILYRSS